MLGRRIPVIKVSTADVKMAEMSAVVTIGQATADRLNSIQSERWYKAGDVIDLGVQSVYHRNWFKRMWAVAKIRKHVLN